MQYILNKGTKVIVVPEGSTVDLSGDHPIIGDIPHNDLQSCECTLKETSRHLDPWLSYNAELRVINRLEEDSPDYVIDALKEQEYRDRTDKLAVQLTRLSAAGEVDKVAEVEKELAIENARIQEEYGQGVSVFITESGECYHTDADCSALVGCEVLEVKLSIGLKDYAECSLCGE